MSKKSNKAIVADLYQFAGFLQHKLTDTELALEKQAKGDSDVIVDEKTFAFLLGQRHVLRFTVGALADIVPPIVHT